MLHDLLLAGRPAGTRRSYPDMPRTLHTFVRLRHTAQIRALYKEPVHDPLDRFNRLRHVWDGTPRALPPSAARLTAFFAFARARPAAASDYPAAARDYALPRHPAGSPERERPVVDDMAAWVPPFALMPGLLITLTDAVLSSWQTEIRRGTRAYSKAKRSTSKAASVAMP